MAQTATAVKLPTRPDELDPSSYLGQRYQRIQQVQADARAVLARRDELQSQLRSVNSWLASARYGETGVHEYSLKLAEARLIENTLAYMAEPVAQAGGDLHASESTWEAEWADYARAANIAQRGAGYERADSWEINQARDKVWRLARVDLS